MPARLYLCRPAGNAVTVPVARWLGERLANPYQVCVIAQPREPQSLLRSFSCAPPARHVAIACWPAHPIASTCLLSRPVLHFVSSTSTTG